MRSYEWYLLPDEERRALLAEHGQMARDYTDVRANTVASFALGDYEWMLAFEADELYRIVDLMRHLRGSETPGATSARRSRSTPAGAARSPSSLDRPAPDGRDLRLRDLAGLLLVCRLLRPRDPDNRRDRSHRLVRAQSRSRGPTKHPG